MSAGAASDGATPSMSQASRAAPIAASSSADLQVQAQELAGAIEAGGRTLDELDAAYNAAQIRLQNLDNQLAGLRSGMTQTAALVAQTRRSLQEQAVLAYVTGGAPVISQLPDRPGQDPSLVVSYAEIIAGGQQRAADAYHAQLSSMAQQSTALATAEKQESATLASIRSDQAQANTALAAQQQALGQVKGQMAVLVSQVQANQQAQAQATQEGQAPTAGAGSAGSAPAIGGSAPGPAARPSSPADATGPSPVAADSPVASGKLTSLAGGNPATGTRPSVPSAPSTRYVPPTTGAAPSLTRDASPPPQASGPVSTGGSASAGAVPTQAPGASQALAYARAQLGKPYQWAGAGPDSFDCSGLVMMAWKQGGVSFPHLAQDQYNMTARISISAAQPGDLIFFGTPDDVYHVGIYIGNGHMIDAPQTGENVSIQSIYWDSLLGAGRVHT